MVKMLESKSVEIDEDSKSEPKVVAELVSLQKEISSQPTEVVELPIEIIVDLPAEPTMELIPPLAGMRPRFSLGCLMCTIPYQSFSGARFTGDWYIDMWVTFQ